MAVIELICQFANYTDEFVWWLRYAYVSPCVSAAFIDRKWIVECIRSVCIRVCAYGCVKILVNRVSIHVPLSIYLAAARTSKCAWRNAFACVDARSRVCASERNRAYVTAWLGAQIQRAQLAHRTSRRIVLILPLHSRGAEEATSLATASSQPAVFVLRPGRDKGFAGFSGMIGAISGWRGLIGFLLTDFEWNLARNFSFFFFLFLVESVEATFFDFGNVRSN